MRRLLQINSVANLGSTGRIAEQLGKKVLAEGWESYIAYGRSAAESSSILTKIGNKLDLVQHVCKSRLFDRHGLASKNPTKKLISLIEEINPEIIHLHNLHGYYADYHLLLQYLETSKIPTVFTLHDFWWLTGHCAYIHESCEKWKTGCEKCPRLKTYPAAIFDNSEKNWKLKKKLFDKASNYTLVPVSHWVDEKLKNSFLRNLPSKVIYNGIDTGLFFPDLEPSEFLTKDKFNILCVATKWTDQNGFDKILALSSILAPDERIIIVGVDERQLRSLPSNILGIKRTENIRELRKLYSQANLLLNPNKEVTFGLVTAEALACGTPSIVFSDTAGEEIVNNDTGFVVDSVADIHTVISKLKNMEKKIFLSPCVDRIKENFSLDRQLNAYFDLYTELIERV